jgi:hypothetical protein
MHNINGIIYHTLVARGNGENIVMKEFRRMIQS